MGTSILAFIVVLGVLIFFHELGHFLFARMFGVGVEKFSLGFGPRIFGWKSGITDYRISAIPLGGYVKMIGEDPSVEMDPQDIALSFTHKHVLKKLLIVAAGPLFNLLLAILIFLGIFLFSGTYILKPTIGEVQENMPAFDSGLQKGDVIRTVDGQAIFTWEEMAAGIAASQGRPILFSIQRLDELINIEIQPVSKKSKNLFGEDIDRYFIGVASAGDVENKRLGLGESVVESLRQTYNIAELTIVSIAKLIKGTLSTKTIGGPIMIAEMAGQQAKEGALNFIFLIALLSINLAIINFLPIPVLDGGHILFFLIELIIGRPVNTRMRELAQQAGIFILIMLMIFVFYNDISRIFTS
jgi:regulator of sigma E protease